VPLHTHARKLTNYNSLKKHQNKAQHNFY